MTYKILSKFIKDLSFEIPDTQTLVSLEKNIKKYNIEIDLTAKPIKNDIIQVETVLKFKADELIENKAHIEINLATLVMVGDDIKNDKSKLERVILISVPTEVYPTIFGVFLNLLKESGLENVNMEKKVDFEELYKKTKKN